jgi:hypothetical protein
MNEIVSDKSCAHERHDCSPHETFQRLIFPHTADQFFSDVWEKRHLHVTRDQNPGLQEYFAALISVDDLDQLLTTIYGVGRRLLNYVRMGEGGILLRHEEFTFNRDSTFAEIDLDRMLSLYRNGASIILNSVQESFGPITRLCGDLSKFFGVSVQANAYITPGG